MTKINFKSYYNTSKRDIALREYGRSVQDIATHIMSIEDRIERTRLAHILIGVMKSINPNISSVDAEEIKHKLWDDLHIITDFKLEVDAPFPMPEKEMLYQKPKPIPYNTNRLMFKHYGKNLELMVAVAKEKPTPEEQFNAYLYILKLLKTYYSDWNNDNNYDANLLDYIESIAKLEFDEEVRTKLLNEAGIMVIERTKRKPQENLDIIHRNKGQMRDKNQQNRKMQHHNNGRKTNNTTQPKQPNINQNNNTQATNNNRNRNRNRNKKVK